MPSLTKKKIRGKTYYYARECKRINGKPKIVWQKYLGRAEDIIAKMTEEVLPDEPTSAIEATVTEFGAVAALYDLSLRLKLKELIDHHVPKRGDGPSVGTYLLAATINRCISPTSKASMGDWYRETALRRWLDVEACQLSSQRFWDNMDRVGPEAIRAIEADLVAHVAKEFKIELSHVLFDATNYFTFIDTFNERCSLAQRGKSKEERKSLRIVGLALLVSADFHVPLMHHTYPGNQHDTTTFSDLTDRLVSRFKAIHDGVERITLVYDKGNNSRPNQDAIEASPYHFVGSLVPTQHPELLKIPCGKFRDLSNDGLPGVTACRVTKKVFGKTRTVVITYNDNLFIAQSQTLLREIAKRRQKLRELQHRLDKRQRGKVRGNNPPTVQSTQKKVDAWMKARHMRDLFNVEIHEEKGLPILRYQFNQRAWTRLQKTLLGKTLIFTDNDDWTDAQIIRAYRAQHHVESAFRTMKDPHHIALRPQYHWTDQKIRVHVFSCVLALMLCSLLRRELHHAGIEMSIPDIIEQLSLIKEVCVIHPPTGRRRKPFIRNVISRMSENQKALFDALDLQRYVAT